MKQGIGRFLALWLCVLATGCVSSGRYHVAPGDGAILPPHTLRTGDKLTIFVRDVFRSPGPVCIGLPRVTRDLDIAVVQLWTGGQLHRSLRVRGKAAVFASEASISRAVATWWQGFTAVPDCFAAGAEEAVRRSLIGQRPMQSDAAIEQWYGPGTASDQPRMLLLRAGMRVCAHDVAEASNPSEYRLGALDCARLTDTADGPVFDPVVTRFAVSLTGSSDTRLASSWGEVQSPYKRSVSPAARPAYLLVYTEELPTAPAMVPSAPEAVNFLVALDLAGKQGGESAIAIVRRLSKSGAFQELCGQYPAKGPYPFITCIKVGERTTFSVDFPIGLNGAMVDMPVGATVQSLLALAAPDMISFDLLAPSDGNGDDPAVGARLRRTLAKARMTRWFDGRRVPVTLEGPAALTLPLQPGDEIRW